jgi:uncharacterized membrane protein YfcA
VFDLLTGLAGVLAGALGAMVGIGGGVLIVPLLHGLLGLSFREATGVSLVGVLATSGSAVTAPAGLALMNVRLAVLLLLFSVSGATLGAEAFTRFSDRTYEIVFGVTAALIAMLMFVRAGRRNVLPADTLGLGPFGDRIFDVDSDSPVAYRTRRLPLAAVVSFTAGVLASFIGIGGGILIVPALNSLCGVPMRVAAATSVLMIGITAVPGVAAHWAHGYLGDFRLAGTAAIGVLVGFQIGALLSRRVRVIWLKVGMAMLLAAVAAQYLVLR